MAAAHAANRSLTSVEARPTVLGGGRRVVDVVLTYNDRRTDVSEKYSVSVDMTEKFPLLVTKLSQYHDC